VSRYQWSGAHLPAGADWGLSGYAGLGARVHATGDAYYTEKISKQKRRELRTALIASAWVAVQWSDHWRIIRRGAG